MNGQPLPFTAVLSLNKETSLGPILVTCGADSQTLTTLEQGVTAGEVARRLEQVLNIPQGAVMFARGQPVGVDYMLQPGDSLEFIRQAGRKAVR